MKRRKLYRNAGPIRQRRGAGRPADGRNGVRISLKVARGVGRRACALAQHVERVAEFRVCGAARQGFLNGLAEHEVGAKQAHRLARRGPHRRTPEPADKLMQNALGRFVTADDPRRNAERPGRGGDEQRAGVHFVRAKTARRQLVFDEPVGGRGIRHAQEGLGQNHEGEAFLGGKRVFPQEILNPAKAAGVRADRIDESAGARIDPRFGLRWQRGGLEKGGRDILVGRRIRRAKSRRFRVCRGEGVFGHRST